MRRAGENPFDLTKASDYTDVQIRDFWVNIADDTDGLVGFLKPKLLTPMLLLGGKGSGKTHLMRYCSAAVQSLRYKGDLRAAARDEGFVGIYSQADGLNVNRFAGKGQSAEVWSSVFCYSFELWLASNFLNVVWAAISPELKKSEEWNTEFVKSVRSIFHIEIAGEASTYEAFQDGLAALQRSIDRTVNNCVISRSLDGIVIGFNPGELLFGLPALIARICPELKHTVFVYLIDEVENLTVSQQRFLNTLVRYRKGNATIKIGARLYGIRTYETLGSGEPIKRDAEFERVELDALLREHADSYEELAKALIVRRVQEFLGHKGFTAENLAGCFEELSPQNYYIKPALDVVLSRDRGVSERPHMRRLREALVKDAGVNQTEVNSVVEYLSDREHPLLEKTNLLAFYKRVSPEQSPLSLADAIAKEEKLFLSGSDGSAKYHDLYSHFSSDLLAQLYREYGRKPIYAGLSTLIHLSQGVPRNLLSLLKHIYRRSAFNGEEPFSGGTISTDSQSQGVVDGAEWFWEDAQPDEFGTQVRVAVEDLATLFRQIRYADNPSECDLCCFLVEYGQLNEDARKTIEMAENWSFLIRVTGMSGAKNDARIGVKFQLNPMLAPRWGLSEYRRGSIELGPPLAQAIFGTGVRETVRAQINKRTEKMYLNGFLRTSLGTPGADQGKLFR